MPSTKTYAYDPNRPLTEADRNVMRAMGLSESEYRANLEYESRAAISKDHAKPAASSAPLRPLTEADRNVMRAMGLSEAEYRERDELGAAR